MSHRRILVVEDNPKNLKLVRDVLTYSGFEVIEATCGEDGVRLAHEERPDLILMDLQLPGIDGARGASADPCGEEPHVPVVAVTAFAMTEDRERAFGSGFDGYVEKPISVRALPQQVQRLPPAGRDRMNDTATKTRVLVVDDQPQNIRLLEAILAPRGYDVRTGRRRARRRWRRSSRATSTSCCSTS